MLEIDFNPLLLNPERGCLKTQEAAIARGLFVVN